MKKIRNILGVIGCFAIALTLSGCTNEEERTITCTMYKKDVINNYELNSTYKVYAKGDVVNKVKTTEEVNSADELILDYFEETLDTNYSAMDEAYGGYEFEITRETGKIRSVTTIDYSKMNLKQLAKDDASIKAILNDDEKITVKGITNLYKQMGAECK